MKSEYAYKWEWYENIVGNPESYKTDPFRIYGNLFFVGTKDSSSILVDTSDGLMLFDTGYPNMQEFLLESIEKLGFKISDIKLIFHTHGHFDHFGATKLLIERSGAKTLMSAIDTRILRDRPELALDYYLPGIKTEFFTTDKELEDGEIIELGNTKVKCILTPGHTPGAMSYEIALKGDEGEKKALLCGGTGLNTLNLEFMEKYGVNYRKDFERSIKLWKSMEPDIYLGNHTTQSDILARHKEGRSFIDKEALRKYISDVEHNYLKMLRDEG
ncbi:MBL fold metallo-hydrolase [Butyrivibrio sp. XB500-5]|uniref:MBL fold metallo-hydrolase n=1 Tax=Butyrivibrio sp. XB500-5 TaxID=2364880 RepID=UPI000EA8566A|nr:MBL fold metallo-hydrolase [Butyrivibrio sp. XB500-5]RKM60299.1 MBL fold metallo-hydrolase [Butyrivibrio sp. XB500-5]